MNKSTLFWSLFYGVLIFFGVRGLVPLINNYWDSITLTQHTSDKTNSQIMHVGQHLQVENASGVVFASTQPFSVEDTNNQILTATPVSGTGYSGYAVVIKQDVVSVNYKIVDGMFVGASLMAINQDANAKIVATTDKLGLQLLYFPGLYNILGIVFCIVMLWKIAGDSSDMVYWSFAWFIAWVITTVIQDKIPDHQYYLTSVVEIVIIALVYWLTRVTKLFENINQTQVN